MWKCGNLRKIYVFMYRNRLVKVKTEYGPVENENEIEKDIH